MLFIKWRLDKKILNTLVLSVETNTFLKKLVSNYQVKKDKYQANVTRKTPLELLTIHSQNKCFTPTTTTREVVVAQLVERSL